MREMMIRAYWFLVWPVVWVANRLGLCSYRWVNICIGARRPDLFDELWHYEHYGTPIPTLPDEVILCGIRYGAAVAEGTVTFVDDFHKNRITFHRDDASDRLIEREALWYVALSQAHQHAAPHVDQAYRWVCAVFGGSHEWRRPVRTLRRQRAASEER